MKTINLICNSFSDFPTKCRRKRIRPKILYSGLAHNHNNEPYTYRWIETDRPNYDYYVSLLEMGFYVSVFFYSEDDRKSFLEELATEILQFNVIKFDVISTSLPDEYYQMESLYGIVVKEKLFGVVVMPHEA